VTRTVIYFSTIVVGQLASLLLLPVVTKFLSPAAYGEYALVLATTGLIGTLGTVWIRNVSMRLYFDYLKIGRTRAFFWTVAGMQALVMLLCLGGSYVVVGGASDALPLSLCAAAALSVLAGDFYALSLNTLRASHRAMSFGAAEILSALVRLAGTWLALLGGWRTPTMLFVFATVSVAAAALAAAPALRRVLAGPIGFERAAVVELVRLGLPSIPLSIGGWIIALSDRTLLAWFLDLRAVGVYSAAYGLADRAVGGLASALFMTAWPAILTAWSHDPLAAPRTISRYLAAFVLLSTGPCVLLILQHNFVLTLLTSRDYASGAEIIPYVVASAWLGAVSTYLNRPLELTKRYGTLSAITLVAAGINLGLNLWLIPRYGVEAAGFSTMCAFVGMAVLSGIFGQRVVRVPIPWSAVLLAGAATAAASFLSYWVSEPLTSIAAFVLIYFGIVAVYMRPRRFHARPAGSAVGSGG
jgi:O-antigen/teichoic acid export membrane protein